MILRDVGDGIKTQLETIQGLQVFSPTELRDSINAFPSAIILLGNTKYHETLSSIGVSQASFRIILVVTRQDLPSALNVLADYIDTDNGSSVKVAIEADRTLGGSVHDCIIMSNKGMGAFTWSGVGYLGTEFSLEVWA